MMVKYLITICFLNLFYFSFSQADGYKNIKLGEKYYDDDLINSYNFSKISENGFRLISRSTASICNIEIAYIDIQINSDSTIKLIQVYTIETIYKDWKDFHDNYKAVSECIVNTVGKASYYEPGIDRADGLITTAWGFNASLAIVR